MISDNYQPTRTLGNGVTTTFTFDWDGLNSDCIIVYFEDVSTGVQTLQTTGFTTTLVDTSGTVEFTVAPSSDYYVIIGRSVPRTQAVDYLTSSGFKADVVEDSFDKDMAVIQQIAEAQDRTFSYPLGTDVETAGYSTDIPTPEALKYLRWNAGETALENAEISTTETTYPSTIGTGALADRPTSPTAGDIYFAQDVATLYICATAGTWTIQNSQSCVIQVTQTGHSFSERDVLYAKSKTGSIVASDYAKAKADSLTTARVAGVVSKVIDADTFELTVAGYAKMSSDSGTYTNANLWLSDSSAGSLSRTAPTAEGSFVVRVATQLSLSEYNISPQEPVKTRYSNGSYSRRFAESLPLRGGTTLEYSAFVMEDGTVMGCGDNTSFQLGVGNINADRETPISIYKKNTINGVKVYTGYDCTFILNTDGSLYACGANAYGQLGVGDTTTRKTFTEVPKPAGYKWTSVYLQKGATSNITVLATAVSISSSTSNALYGWGYNVSGALGQGDNSNKTSPVQIATGSTTTAIAEASISSSGHALYCTLAGKVYAAGQNAGGQLGDGSTTATNTFAQVVGITCLNVYALGASSFAIGSGQLYAWGENSQSELGDNSTTDRTTPVTISGMTTVSTVIGDGYVSGGTMAAILTDGTVRTWGYNSLGQCGTAGTARQATPYNPSLSGITKGVFFGGGNNRNSALAFHNSSDDVYVSGYNGNGQLGQGNTTNLTSFTAVSSLQTLFGSSANPEISDICAVGYGNYGQLLILYTDGSVFTCGYGASGQLGLGDKSNTHIFTRMLF